MRFCPSRPMALAGLVLSLAAITVDAAYAETLDSKVADTRTVVAFSVKPDAAQKWLPQGYVAGSIPKGPFKSANYLLFFIDRLLHLSADGKPKGGGSYRMVALVIPGKHTESGQRAMFIARIYSPHDGAGPYANSVKSTVRRELSRNGIDVGPGSASDLWAIERDGGRLSVAMKFRSAIPRLIESKLQPISATDPKIRYIYQYRQLIDVVRSAPANIDRIERLDLDVSIPELADAFDGSEELIGIGVIPWYARETFKP